MNRFNDPAKFTPTVSLSGNWTQLKDHPALAVRWVRKKRGYKYEANTIVRPSFKPLIAMTQVIHERPRAVHFVGLAHAYVSRCAFNLEQDAEMHAPYIGRIVVDQPDKVLLVTRGYVELLLDLPPQTYADNVGV